MLMLLLCLCVDVCIYIYIHREPFFAHNFVFYNSSLAHSRRCEEGQARERERESALYISEVNTT